MEVEFVIWYFCFETDGIATKSSTNESGISKLLNFIFRCIQGHSEPSELILIFMSTLEICIKVGIILSTNQFVFRNFFYYEGAAAFCILFIRTTFELTI